MKKEKYQIEFIFEKVSVNNLWPRVSTSFGLGEWFADKVEEEKGEFVFSWHGSAQKAQVVFRRNSAIRFHWDEEPAQTYFEFAVFTNELTGFTSLRITDFAEPEEMDDAVRLWGTEIERLRRILGV